MKLSAVRLLSLATSLGLLIACSAQTPEAASDASAPAAEDSAPSEAAAPAEAAPAPVEEPAAEAAAPATAAVAGAGEETYKKTCAMCHGTTAMGAPMVGKKDDWHDRIAQGKDTLYKHAIEGFSGAKGVMPAKGGNPSLDDEAIKSTVDYMVAQSQ